VSLLDRTHVLSIIKRRILLLRCVDERPKCLPIYIFGPESALTIQHANLILLFQGREPREGPRSPLSFSVLRKPLSEIASSVQIVLPLRKGLRARESRFEIDCRRFTSVLLSSLLLDDETHQYSSLSRYLEEATSKDQTCRGEDRVDDEMNQRLAILCSV
jgi:hypothetical protein